MITVAVSAEAYPNYIISVWVFVSILEDKPNKKYTTFSKWNNNFDNS